MGLGVGRGGEEGGLGETDTAYGPDVNVVGCGDGSGRGGRGRGRRAADGREALGREGVGGGGTGGVLHARSAGPDAW